MEEINEINESFTPNYIKEFGRSLCKIIIGEKSAASGFFMITKINQQKVRFLITNNHVISDQMIIQKINIEIYLECINEKRVIQLDNEQRLIKTFPKIDITIVEILDSDNLKNKVKCLKRDYLEKGKGYETYLSKDILIFHHPKGKDAICSSGKILTINNYTFGHNAFTAPGSSGSAIILKDDYDDDDDYKIIGIHCKKNTITYINYGVFIGQLIDELRDQDINLILKKREEQTPIDNQIIILRYNTFNSNKIRIFGHIFVEKNINNCKIVVEDKEYKLSDKFNINNMKKTGNEYEIKLKILNNIDDLSYMFNQCNCLSQSSEINNINISNITNISYLFSECQKISQLPDISKWNTSKVENMACIFAGCQSLSSLPDISKWNTSNVKNMMGVFAGCKNLSSIPDISKWNTNKVCKFDYMFYRCDLLKEIPDISKWDTKNIISMAYMFYNCSNLSYLPDISGWNTSKVKYIEFMFANCQNLLSLPNFTSWDTRQITSMQELFSNLKLVKKPINFPKKIKRKNKDSNHHNIINYFANLVK